MSLINRGKYGEPNIYSLPRFLFSKVVIIGAILGFLSPIIILFELIIGASYLINTVQCMHYISIANIYRDGDNEIVRSVINGYGALGSFFVGRVIGIAIKNGGFFFLKYSLEREITYPFAFLFSKKTLDFFYFIFDAPTWPKVIFIIVSIIAVAFIQWKILLQSIAIQKKESFKPINRKNKQSKDKKIIQGKINKNTEEKSKRNLKLRSVSSQNTVKTRKEKKEKKEKNNKFNRMKKDEYY